MGRQVTQVPRKAMEALQRRPWHGNVRELRNVLEHAVIVSTGSTLSAPSVEAAEMPAASSSQALADVERDHIIRVLRQSGGRVTGPNGAAEILGLNRGTLYGRMRKLGIPLPKAKSQPSSS
jgi:DNA-binding NtrC family response regulator